MRNHVPMGTIRRGVGAALAASFLAVAFAAPEAGAAETITADTECCTFVSPGIFEQDMGEVPVFDNPVGADALHNVTSTARGPDGAPLFRSGTIGAGSTSRVEGAQYLTGGSYPFYCTLHGFSMGGQLLVSGENGTAAARPKIRLVIPSQRLASIRKSGLVRVSVKALAGSPVVNLSAKSGTRPLASAFGVAVSPGATKTVRMRLTRTGRKAIAKGRKASLSVTGAVAFGTPVTTRRTVR
jgi:plastocyanin